MIKLVRFAIVSASATVMLATLVGSAHAGRLSASSQTFRVTWRELAFTDPFGVSVVCPLTIEGSLYARSIIKSNYNIIGAVTRAIVGPGETCTGGSATILGAESLPWIIRYQSFARTLPDITSIRTLMEGAAIRIASRVATCLFTAKDTVREHIGATFTREAGGDLTTVAVSGEIISNERCFMGIMISGRVSGTSTSLTVLNAATRIAVTLI